MSSSAAFENCEDVYAATSSPCPRWCITPHGTHLGEEDWIHASEPLRIADGVLASLCMSVVPDTGAVDGPYVFIGGSEYTVAGATSLASALITLASSGDQDG